MTTATLQTDLDPALFKPDAIEAETSAFNKQLAEVLSTVPPVWTQPPAVTRQAREEGRGPTGPIVLSDMAVNRTIDGPAGALPIRVFVPDTVTGVYLHFHGGGWTLGRPHHHDLGLEGIAKRSRQAVVSVDYRLAPENPYPAGPDDCEAAALWLIDNAQREFGASRLCIGGDSAGANLAVVTLLRLRDKHGLTPFECANLIYGCYDLTGTPSVKQSPPDTLILTPQAIDWFTNQYVPDAAERRTTDVSPLWADLHNMPRALFSVGTLDPLVDDTLFMYGRWIAAGNEAELAVYPGGVHGFIGMPYGLARRANERGQQFLCR
ncbi:MAG: alpha/beta hydrolase [Chloroflexi bacterium]|nr:alpha/beta hydrolase [Chloroflexota bacterium]